MRLLALLGIGALALALAPVACGGSADSSQSNVSTPPAEGDSNDELKALVITEDDSGKTLQIGVGQNITIKLQANPTTGYDWQVTQPDAALGTPTKRFSRNGDGTGSGGVDTFTWKWSPQLHVNESHDIQMAYERALPGSVPPAKTFKVTIYIAGHTCPDLAPPPPGFCANGLIQQRKDSRGCTTGFDCITDCRSTGCSAGSSCITCWEKFACVPAHAVC
jgi:predicted secreted protein